MHGAVLVCVSRAKETAWFSMQKDRSLSRVEEKVHGEPTARGSSPYVPGALVPGRDAAKGFLCQYRHKVLRLFDLFLKTVAAFQKTW
jgi:hypothetical protein